MSRSAHWRDVAAVAERTRTQCSQFDPESDAPEDCITEGVDPIVTLFVEVRRSGETLSDVERSLLEGALNDWLAKYAACYDQPFDGGYTVREVALATMRNGSLAETVRDLVDVEGAPDGGTADGADSDTRMADGGDSNDGAVDRTDPDDRS